jgi:hypothetical protein
VRPARGVGNVFRFSTLGSRRPPPGSHGGAADMNALGTGASMRRVLVVQRALSYRWGRAQPEGASVHEIVA